MAIAAVAAPRPATSKVFFDDNWPGRQVIKLLIAMNVHVDEFTIAVSVIPAASLFAVLGKNYRGPMIFIVTRDFVGFEFWLFAQDCSPVLGIC